MREHQVAADSETLEAHRSGRSFAARRHRLERAAAAPRRGLNACEALASPRLSAGMRRDARGRSARVAGDRRVRAGLRRDARRHPAADRAVRDRAVKRELDALCEQQPLGWRSLSCARRSPSASTSCATGRNGAPGASARAITAGTRSSTALIERAACRRDAGARGLPARLLEPPAGGALRARTGARRGPAGAAPFSAGSTSSASSIASSCEPGPTG